MSYLRRDDVRVPVDAMYSEYVAERQMLGKIIDASLKGLRVQRLLRRTKQPGRIVQLEFELPGTGEMIWAKGEIAFDQLWRAPETLEGVVRTSGVRIVAAANKHLRILRDWVMTVSEDAEPWWARAF